MKSDESRSPSKRKHNLEHAAPTVIHDPEQKMNLLERWLRHAMENPVRFWSVVIAAVVVLVGLSLLASGLQLGHVSTNDAWAKLEAASTSEEREEIALKYPKTPVAWSALLLVAEEYYMRGFADLPANKDVAKPLLYKALERFQKVADSAPPDSIQARTAALGVARTLEARNELKKALTQYESVAAKPAWKDTPESREAARLAALMKKPETVAFYDQLDAYKPPQATLPPGGTGSIDFPSMGSGLIPGLSGNSTTIPGLGGGSTSPFKMPDPLTIPPPPPTTATKAETPTPTPKTVDLTPAPTPASTTPTLPADPFASKPATPAPKAETPAGLPADPFAPAGK
jgi:hypothetical protein